MLGELGGLVGREIEAWMGLGLREKEERILLWNSEGKEGGFGGDSLWTSGSLSDGRRTLQEGRRMKLLSAGSCLHARSGIQIPPAQHCS